MALLRFGIGLELSINRLRRIWKPVLFGGILQVGMTMAIPLLSGQGGRIFDIFTMMLKAVAILIGVLVIARLISLRRRRRTLALCRCRSGDCSGNGSGGDGGCGSVSKA